MQRLICAVLIAFSLFVQNMPAQNTPAKPGGCAKGGAVFGIDQLGRALMLKDRTGYLSTTELPKDIPIWKLQLAEGGTVSSTPVQMKFEDVRTNDLVCIEGDSAGQSLSKVTVVPRTEAERAQRDFAMKWQSNSVFGSIVTIDAAAGKITVNPLVAQSTPPPTEIRLSGDVVYRTYPSTAMRINDASPIRLEDLQTGQTVYIRGERSPGDPVLRANLLIKGGMRGIVGTFLEVSSSKIRMREFGTGRTLDIHIPSTLAYRTMAELTTVSGAVRLDESRLAIIQFSDLQPGDTVLVIGTTDYDKNTGTGLGVVTHFGYFGTIPNDSGHQVSWIFK